MMVALCKVRRPRSTGRAAEPHADAQLHVLGRPTISVRLSCQCETYASCTHVSWRRHRSVSRALEQVPTCRAPCGEPLRQCAAHGPTNPAPAKPALLHQYVWVVVYSMDTSANMRDTGISMHAHVRRSAAHWSRSPHARCEQRCSGPSPAACRTVCVAAP